MNCYFYYFICKIFEFMLNYRSMTQNRKALQFCHLLENSSFCGHKHIIPLRVT